MFFQERLTGVNTFFTLAYMTTYIAFLRGINLGKRQVKSDQLKSIFARLGFENIRTVIASGNVIFGAKEKDAGKLTQKIEKGLKDNLGFDVMVFLRSEAELEKILDDNPFKDAETGKTYINFLSDVPDKSAVKEIEARTSATEIFRFNGREMYMLFHVLMSESVFFKKNDYEKVLGVLATNRNLNTVVKIAAKMNEK
jgi:uncharacterized protein (DUF1697 family)